MADPVKALSTDITLTTANTVSGGTLIRLVNSDPANSAVITQKLANGAIISTITLGHHSTDYGCLYLIKQPTDTLTANNAVNDGAYTGSGIKAVSVGYY